MTNLGKISRPNRPHSTKLTRGSDIYYGRMCFSWTTLCRNLLATPTSYTVQINV